MKKTTSFDRILDILFLIADQSELTAQEISALLHFPVSTTYKYLDILLKRDLLGKAPAGKGYCLGLMTYKLGSRFIEGNGFLNIARPHMKSLSNQNKETVILTVISGWEGLVIAKTEPNVPVKLSFELNTRVPLHAGAAQKVLLAFQTDSFVEEFIEAKGLHELTPNTMTDPDLLRDQLRTIRERGYAIADSEVQSWVKAIAAPVFDHNAKILASLAIVSPENLLNNTKQDVLIEMLRESASKISRDLGYQKKH